MHHCHVAVYAQYFVHTARALVFLTLQIVRPTIILLSCLGKRSHAWLKENSV
ncbi:hypothetical protein BDR03DRAFT_1018905 [Suillus americanus]|nr:hypothetical protein BDR03DRAFT_1018905 [Suillus americanus]